MDEYRLKRDKLRRRFIGLLTEEELDEIRCLYNVYAEEQTVRMCTYGCNDAFVEALKEAEEFDDEWLIYVRWLDDLLFKD